MFSLHQRPVKLCDGITRRELIRVGGLGVFGLSLPALLRAKETAPSRLPLTDKTFGRAKSVIFLYLAGGPPQHETFDPKPHAPAEIRGEFKAISTNVPGIQFCELLPRTARIADRLAVVRSMSTDDNNHDSSSAWVLTGHKYVGANARMIQPSDWPYLGSILKMLKPSEVLPPLTSVWLPDMMRLNENVTPAGQTGGFLGAQWDPDRFLGDPSDPNYEVEGLRPGGLPPLRLKQRVSLLEQVDEHFGESQRGEAVRVYDRFQQQAIELLTSGRAREAFAIGREPDKVRERYGRSSWGQCVLLARRLVEAGVRLVHVQWPREPGDNAVDNPLWDTHAQNADRLEDVLCPQFDVGFTALIEDLDQRGLLDETLVIAIGEFGRTPKINPNGGRDHWGPVFSFVMAGAGIGGGQLFGASDKQGAYPARDRVQPGDLAATIYHLLGMDYKATFHDREGRERRLTEGEPMYKLLGTEPATRERTEPGGDLARVPPYDGRLLLAADFDVETSGPLRPLDGPSRPKGWRAAPLVAAAGGDFGVTLIEAGQRVREAAFGFGSAQRAEPAKIDAGAMAILAQEVRSPFAGSYVLSVRARGDGSSREFYEAALLANFTCRLVFFQFTDRAKSAAQRKELATVSFRPSFGPDFHQFKLEKVFVNPKPGDNFSFGLGLGIAVIVEKTSPGTLELPADGGHAGVRIESVKLDFIGKARNPDVVV